MSTPTTLPESPKPSPDSFPDRNKPRALDLFCGAGGATRGLQLAGFHVTGVDIRPQPRYCGDVFVQADALCLPFDMSRYRPCMFDFVWASPPCQAYSNAQRLQNNEHPQLIEPVRDMLRKIGVPFAIENVPGAPLRKPIVLCGSAFGLSVYRHRLVEMPYIDCEQPLCRHDAPQAKMGRPPKDGEFIHVVGNFSGVDAARKAMGIDWMKRDELSEAIPPAYSAHIGRAVLRELAARSPAPPFAGCP